MKIHDWLTTSTKLLHARDIASARLDAEIILAHTLKKSRTWLHMYRDEEIDDRLREIADARIDLRCDYTPIAYIIGHKEFYGRTFTVTPSVLIPSPESEALIELAKSLTLPKNSHAIDIGTGSGALGLTLKMEVPEIHEMILTDISDHALTIAKRNNDQRFHLENINYYRSDLLNFWEPIDRVRPFANLIIANLPYVDPSWQRNRETDHEPKLALFASDQGYKIIFRLIEQAERAIMPSGYLLLEADPRQHAAIIERAARHHFSLQKSLGYGLLFAK